MYFTIDAGTPHPRNIEPESVVFVSKAGTNAEEHLFLFRDGGWVQETSGTFTMPLSEDFPVNSLFLIVKTENEDVPLLNSVAEAADSDGPFALLITQINGVTSRIPIRSVEKGTRSLSFYRQSEHQAL